MYYMVLSYRSRVYDISVYEGEFRKVVNVHNLAVVADKFSSSVRSGPMALVVFPLCVEVKLSCWRRLRKAAEL